MACCVAASCNRDDFEGRFLALTHVFRFCEKISLDTLSEKADAFHRATGGYSNYQVDYDVLPMSEM